jgi:hypothetical protein
MAALVAVSTAEVTARFRRGEISNEEVRTVLITRLRVEHGCTLTQIGEALSISADRV